MNPLYVITVERARADGIGPRQLEFAARWNQAAVKMAARRKDNVSLKRHQRQADELRAVAKVLAG